jgi:hypothetical protein
VNVPSLDFTSLVKFLESRYGEKVKVQFADDYLDMVTLFGFSSEPALRQVMRELAEVMIQKSSTEKGSKIAVSKELKGIVRQQPRENSPPPAMIFMLVSAKDEMEVGGWGASMMLEFGHDPISRMAGIKLPETKMPAEFHAKLEHCLGIKLIREAQFLTVKSPFENYAMS